MKLFVVALVVLAVSGCPYIKKNTDIRECSAATTIQAVNIIMPQVIAVIAGKAPDWENALNLIVLEFGDAAICAIQAVLKDLVSGVEPISKFQYYTASFEQVSTEEQIERCNVFLGK